MGPPLSPRETRRSGRRSAPSVSASASKSPDSDQPPPKERTNSSRTTASSTNNRSKRLKQEDCDEGADDRKQTSVPSTSSGNNNNGNGKGRRRGKDKEKQLNGSANEDAEVVVEDQPQDPPEDEEEQGITRCVCGSSGALSKRPCFCSCFDAVPFTQQKTTLMPVSLWSNARLAKFGSTDFAWAISQKNKYTTTTTTARFVDPNYT